MDGSMNQWQIELRLDGWVGGRVTRVEGGDPFSWHEMDWLANLINRLVGLWVDLVFISLSIAFSGFGNLIPKTRLGQGMTIIFCLIGISLTMLALKSAGELLQCGIRFIVTKTKACLFKNDPPKNKKGKVSFFLRCVFDDCLTSFGKYVISIHGRLQLYGELIRMVHNFHNYCLWRLHLPRLICKEGRSWRDSRLSGGVLRPYFLFPVYHGS